MATVTPPTPSALYNQGSDPTSRPAPRPQCVFRAWVLTLDMGSEAPESPGHAP